MPTDLNSALDLLGEALALGDSRQITRVYLQYGQNINPTIHLSNPERDKLATALRQTGAELTASFRQSLESEDDEAIAANYDARLFKMVGNLSASEHARGQIATVRQTALVKLKDAFASNDSDTLVSVYLQHESVLRGCRKFSESERRQVTIARRKVLLHAFKLAIRAKDLSKIAETGTNLLEAGGELGNGEWKSYQFALRATTALDQCRQTLLSGDEYQIAAITGREHLEQAGLLPIDDKNRIEIAQRRVEVHGLLTSALERNDDLSIARLSQGDLFRNSPLLNDEQRHRCDLARRRVEALQALREAFAKNDDEQIVKIYETGLLQSTQLLTPAECKRIDAACSKLASATQLKAAIAGNDPQDIAVESSQVPAAAQDDDTWELTQEAGWVVDLLQDLRANLADADENLEQKLHAGTVVLHAFPQFLLPQEIDSIAQTIQTEGRRTREELRIDGLG